MTGLPLFCRRWLILQQQWVDVSSRQPAIRIGADTQIRDLIGDLAPGVEHAGWNNNDVAGSDLAAVSARARRAVSARSVHDVDVGARLLVGHRAARGEDASTRQDDVGFGRVVMIRAGDWIAGLIVGRSTVDDP